MLKRNKIKKKYLNEINNKDNKEKNIYDKIEKIVIKSLITIGLIILLIIWNIIPIIILAILRIDIEKINPTSKVLISFISDILLLLTFILIYLKTIKKDFKNYFLHNFKKNITQSLSIWLIGLGIMYLSNIIIFFITNGQIAQNEEAVRKMIEQYPIYMTFQTIIYAPISEEIIFRKSIKDITNNKYIYICLSGLIFGGLHVITSISNPQELIHLIPYFALGCTFAYLYHKTDNIFSTITAHSIHNALALLLYFKG